MPWHFLIELTSPKELLVVKDEGLAPSRGEAFASAQRALAVLYVANTPRQDEPFDVFIDISWKEPEGPPSLEELGF